VANLSGGGTIKFSLLSSGGMFPLNVPMIAVSGAMGSNRETEPLSERAHQFIEAHLSSMTPLNASKNSLCGACPEFVELLGDQRNL
jgi:hypothetical protein